MAYADQRAFHSEMFQHAENVLGMVLPVRCRVQGRINQHELILAKVLCTVNVRYAGTLYSLEEPSRPWLSTALSL
jgi:hypothetical protein